MKRQRTYLNSRAKYHGYEVIFVEDCLMSGPDCPDSEHQHNIQDGSAVMA